MGTTEIKTEPENLDNSNQICRLCLSEESLESVFKEESLHKWISDFLTIVISTEDRISQNICAICRIRLIDFHQYRLRCQEVQSVLQARIQRDEDHDNNSENHQLAKSGKGKQNASPIQCEVCHKVFIVQRQLADHRRIHRPKNVCKWCGKSYVDRQRLEKHLKTHANEVLEEKKTANTIGKDLIVDKIKETKPHEGSMYEKQKQGDETSTESELNKSSGNINNEDSGQHEQLLKLVPDTTGMSLQKENDRHNGIEDMIVVEEIKIEVRNDEDDDDATEPDGTSVSSEVVSYGPGNLCETNLEKTAIDESQTTGFQCPKCNKMCKSRQALWCHNKVVHGPKNFPCLVCGFRFAREKDLDYHFRSRRHLQKVQDTSEKEIDETSNKHKKQNSTPHRPDGDITGIVSPNTGTVSNEEAIMSDKTVSQKNSVNIESQGMLVESMQVDVASDHSSNVGKSISTDNIGSRYPCEKCNRTFNRQCQLKNHMKIHDNASISIAEEELSITEEDDSDYGERASSNDHFVEGPDGEQQLQCSICDKVFPPERKKLQDHIRNAHGPKNHPCTICGKPFTMRSSMEKHKFTHQPQRKKRRVKTADEKNSIARPFECDVCQKKFVRNRNLIDHKKYIHGPKNHECEICGFRFSMRFNLDMHMQRHTRYRDSKEDFIQFKQILQNEKSSIKEEESTGESVKGSNLSSTTQSQTENKDEKTECRQCNRTFPNLRFLWLHYKFSHKKKIKCSLCNVVFATNKRLVGHMLTKHKKEDGSYQPLKCEECNKVFSTTSQLTAHKIVHGPRIYCCKHCPKTFSRPQHLKSHMKSHEDVGDDFMKPASIREGYECEICHKVVQLKKHMQGHIRRVHGSELHECSICSRLFKTREELELHSKIHDVSTGQKDTEESSVVKKDDQPMQTDVTESEAAIREGNTVTVIQNSTADVECGECHKRFSNKRYLYNHIRNVHDPKQHLCSSCGKAFLSSQLLQRHQLTHKNDNQSLHCTKCNKSFPTWRKTYMHMRNHAPKKHKCNICSNSYAQSQATQKHAKSPSSIGNLHPCSICSMQFTSKKKLNHHTKTSHQQEAQPYDEQSDDKMDHSQEVDRASSSKGPLLMFEAEDFKIEPE